MLPTSAATRESTKTDGYRPPTAQPSCICGCTLHETYAHRNQIGGSCHYGCTRGTKRDYTRPQHREPAPLQALGAAGSAGIRLNRFCLLQQRPTCPALTGSGCVECGTWSISSTIGRCKGWRDCDEQVLASLNATTLSVCCSNLHVGCQRRFTALATRRNFPDCSP